MRNAKHQSTLLEAWESHVNGKDKHIKCKLAFYRYYECQQKSENENWVSTKVKMNNQPQFNTI